MTTTKRQKIRAGLYQFGCTKIEHVKCGELGWKWEARSEWSGREIKRGHLKGTRVQHDRLTYHKTLREAIQYHEIYNQ